MRHWPGAVVKYIEVILLMQMPGERWVGAGTVKDPFIYSTVVPLVLTRQLLRQCDFVRDSAGKRPSDDDLPESGRCPPGLACVSTSFVLAERPHRAKAMKNRWTPEGTKPEGGLHFHHHFP